MRQQAAITFKTGDRHCNISKTSNGTKPHLRNLGSGGVYNGLNAAKLFALGATTVGYAKPMLEAALKSSEKVSLCMQTIEYELKSSYVLYWKQNPIRLKEKLG